MPSIRVRRTPEAGRKGGGKHRTACRGLSAGRRAHPAHAGGAVLAFPSGYTMGICENPISANGGGGGDPFWLSQIKGPPPPLLLLLLLLLLGSTIQGLCWPRRKIRISSRRAQWEACRTQHTGSALRARPSCRLARFSPRRCGSRRNSSDEGAQPFAGPSMHTNGRTSFPENARRQTVPLWGSLRRAASRRRPSWFAVACMAVPEARRSDVEARWPPSRRLCASLFLSPQPSPQRRAADRPQLKKEVGFAAWRASVTAATPCRSRLRAGARVPLHTLQRPFWNDPAAPTRQI